MSDTTVLIVGAGPTGLTLACELARLGVAFRIVEAAPGPQPGSRGKGIQPRSLEVFDDLGIADQVIAHGRMGMPITAHLPDGTERRTEADAFTGRPDIPYGASLITPEWRVEEALRGLLRRSGGQVGFGTALESFTQSGTGVTAVVRGEAGPETIRADWLVGADGGHSVVRKGSGAAFDGETLDEVRMIVADVDVDGLDRDSWHTWRSDEGIVVLCPLPSTDVFQFQASIAPGQDPALTLENMQAILERRSGSTGIRLREPEWRTLWRANIRLVDHYREGRVLLAGDAAHIHSPAGGQGMNTGIQDSHNLGWKLAAVANGADEALLDTYEDERRPVAEGVLALSNARLRETLEKKAIPIRGNADTMQLTVGYRGSSLVADDRGAAADDVGSAPGDAASAPGDAASAPDGVLRAGDRAPDATGLETLAGTRRLFELTAGGRFTLLAFGPVDDAGLPGIERLRILRIVDRPERDGDVTDTSGALAAAYSAGPRTLVLVRPDGYVGCVSDAGDVGAVRRVLAACGVAV
ncbi:FAD-dependent monooxygenase [Frondihabitans australicus]|uniref:2-polyprenyl-6-methoxyphenol hydroxylase-like FAD-dependent oxidoreductase n=1 Tax=Frondihabitans australicus TaxID=386892 RepID=A0A495IMV9_9MICO|nr:FAD-dependent monooxygenase [Frondihabitans australicus]RKR76465.1 2-polyprenyl-6-methoxyphenol hydroxylase-like FAD-dependent oxidoreductase [Frondihabitans australicus]